MNFIKRIFHPINIRYCLLKITFMVAESDNMKDILVCFHFNL